MRDWLAARPALRAVLLVAAGIVLGGSISIAPLAAYALLVAASILTVATRRSAVADIASQCALVSLGFTLIIVRTAEGGVDRIAPPVDTVRVRLTGEVISPPSRSASGWSAVVGTERMDIGGRIDGRRRDVLVRGRTTATTPHQIVPSAGDVVTVEGLAGQYPFPRNPGDLDYGRYLEMNGISAIVQAESVSVLAEEVGSLRSLLGRMQETLYRKLDALHPSEHAAFLKGIMLGYRSELPGELREAFLATGTVHILAVSGSNVALIALVAAAAAGLLRLPRRWLVVASALAVLGYMWITGSSPSVVRATIMALTVIAALSIGRRVDLVQSLSLAALLLLLLDPRNLYDLGFQLSFCSVASIIIGVPIADRWSRRLPEEVRESKLLRPVVQVMAVTLAAQVGTLPLSAIAFGRISVVALAANLVVVPLSGLVLVLGVVELAFVGFVPFIASVYADANAIAMEVLLGLVRRAGSVSWASIAFHRWDPLVGVAAYLLMMSWILRPWAQWRNRTLLAAFAVVVQLTWRSSTGLAPGRFEALMVDVGQGDSHVLRSATGRVIVIDAGPSPLAADRNVLPTLNELGIRQIDVLVLTHPHADHIGGAARLLDRIPVRTLAVADTAGWPRSLKESVRRHGTPIVLVSRGMRIEPDSSMRMYVLHPPADLRTRNWNDRSVVIKTQYGDRSALFTGDAEEPSERTLVGTYGSFLRSDVLKMAHHGSRTGTTDAFLEVVKPVRALVSVGWANRFRHPSPERMAELERRHIETTRTMLSGAAWLRSDGRTWTDVPWQ